MSVNRSYVHRTIKPGASITTNARLHWIGYASGMLLPLLGWLATYYVPTIANQPWAKWVMLTSLIWSAALLYLAHIEQATSEIVITDDHRLIGSYGHALERTSFELELAKIDEINVSQSLLGRLCGYGTVTVGHHGMTTAIGDIDDPLQFQEKLLMALRIAQGNVPANMAA